ncbi:hypothetical protein Scep_019354 [Stephania cephalantha]|uniref:Uncharacterized protein n=1 Tax=Stephania cephalantha TaxID=152367 RepID=A0AAP0NN79_9MAGN
MVFTNQGLSSSSLQTHFVDPKRQDLCHRTVAEDPPPPPSPSSSTAIVDVDRDSPPQSFIRDRESPRSLIHPRARSMRGAPQPVCGILLLFKVIVLIFQLQKKIYIKIFFDIT